MPLDQLSRRPADLYIVGRTNSGSSVAEKNPPITKVASGFFASEPAACLSTI